MGLAWGGYSNGSIPPAALHPAPNFSSIGAGFASVAAGSNSMRSDAAIQLSGMMQAFFKQFNTALRLSEGYRSRSVQNLYWDRYVNRKPGWTIAAVPGTSIHGWGLSADLSVNGGNPSGVHLQWLRTNAAKYGFVNDVSTEPWHWSYRTDLVTRSIVVPGYIDNPNTTQTTPAATNTKNINLENDMPRLVRVEDPSVKNLHGLVSFLFPDRVVRTKNADEIYRIGRAWGLIPPNKDWNDYKENISAVEFQAAADEINNARNTTRKETTDAVTAAVVPAVVQGVWNAMIDGYNGPQKAAARLAGIDQGKASSVKDDIAAAVVKALPAASGGSAPALDVEALTKNLTKALLDAASERLKS